LEEQTTRSAITFTSIMEAIAVRKWFYQYISKNKKISIVKINKS
jgi:hypothetical protein